MSATAEVVRGATGRGWELRWHGDAGTAKADVIYDTPEQAARMARECAAETILQDGDPVPEAWLRG